MQNVTRASKASANLSSKADEFRRTVRAILVVLERLAAHAGVESNELDLLVYEFFNDEENPKGQEVTHG